jgi:choline dehydrogenase-like flavoprotein
MANEKVDVVIVGAGASGAAFASVLAKGGKKVVLLEAGPDWQLSDLISSEMWGRRIRPAGAPFRLEGKNPFGYAGQAGWGVGGAALHYFANHPRLLETDYRMKSEHNRGLDWPIAYKDVAPFYDRVAREVGMAGDAKAEEKWRPAGDPYPMPPMKTFRQGEILKKGFESIGIRMAPAPVAMNSTDFKGRPACIYDGWCHVVTGVEYFDDKKQKQVQEASVVVLSAWSGQNPRILLNSATDKHPKGLANANDLVGKYMMAHSVAGVSAMFDEDMENHLGTIGAQYMSYDRYPKTSYKSGFGSSYITVGAAQKTHDFANSRPDLIGSKLHEYMKQAARGFSRVSLFGEELPSLENRIELISDKDAHGMPLARLVHSFDDDAVALWRANIEEGQRALKAAGAKEAWAGAVMPTSHLLGGTIMGTGAANSVVNSYGQTHEIPNLWVSGPGIFPTEGASNPTYTILALSLRGADQLASSWGSVTN